LTQSTTSSCCLCGKELGEALPVLYYGKSAHMGCVDYMVKECTH